MLKTLLGQTKNGDIFRKVCPMFIANDNWNKVEIDHLFIIGSGYGKYGKIDMIRNKFGHFEGI